MEIPKRIYQENNRPFKIPFEEDLSRYAPEYTPEVYTKEERRFANPFFSNLDRPAYMIYLLPEEVIGAVCSRDSRSEKDLRKTFIAEYVIPVVYPEKQKNWENLTRAKQDQKMLTKLKFIQFIDFWDSHGGIEGIVNDQRAENLFDQWVGMFSDESILELGNIHLGLQGISNALWEEIITVRLASYLGKSTRYVPFDIPDASGHYRYITPGEIRGTKDESRYRRDMDEIFKFHNRISPKYLEYICEKFPQGANEKDGPFIKSRGAKRFDDLRDLLVFGSEINVAINANGRSMESIVNKLLSNGSGEARWWGQTIVREMDKVAPAFIKRAKTSQGAEVQHYRSNLAILREELAAEIFPGETNEASEPYHWVRLISSTPQADVEVLSAFLFSSQKRLSLLEIREKVIAMGDDKRKDYLRRIIEERKSGRPDFDRKQDRFKKVPRAWENAHYLFEIWGRGGDYRDLHRHRMLTEERQPFTTKWGHDLEKELLESPFMDQVQPLIKLSAELHQELARNYGPKAAEYPLLFTFIQHWYMRISARELHWIPEIRTSPQARPHYKEIAQQMGTTAINKDPALFQGLMIGWDNDRIARRESEKKIAAKLDKKQQ